MGGNKANRKSDADDLKPQKFSSKLKAFFERTSIFSKSSVPKQSLVLPEIHGRKSADVPLVTNTEKSTHEFDFSPIDTSTSSFENGSVTETEGLSLPPGKKLSPRLRHGKKTSSITNDDSNISGEIEASSVIENTSSSSRKTTAQCGEVSPSEERSIESTLEIQSNSKNQEDSKLMENRQSTIMKNILEEFEEASGPNNKEEESEVREEEEEEEVLKISDGKKFTTDKVTALELFKAYQRTGNRRAHSYNFEDIKAGINVTREKKNLSEKVPENREKSSTEDKNEPKIAPLRISRSDSENPRSSSEETYYRRATSLNEITSGTKNIYPKKSQPTETQIYSDKKQNFEPNKISNVESNSKKKNQFPRQLSEPIGFVMPASSHISTDQSHRIHSSVMTHDSKLPTQQVSHRKAATRSSLPSEQQHHPDSMYLESGTEPDDQLEWSISRQQRFLNQSIAEEDEEEQVEEGQAEDFERFYQRVEPYCTPPHPHSGMPDQHSSYLPAQQRKVQQYPLPGQRRRQQLSEVQLSYPPPRRPNQPPPHYFTPPNVMPAQHLPPQHLPTQQQIQIPLRRHLPAQHPLHSPSHQYVPAQQFSSSPSHRFMPAHHHTESPTHRYMPTQQFTDSPSQRFMPAHQIIGSPSHRFMPAQQFADSPSHRLTPIQHRQFDASTDVSWDADVAAELDADEDMYPVAVPIAGPGFISYVPAQKIQNSMKSTNKELFNSPAVQELPPKVPRAHDWTGVDIELVKKVEVEPNLKSVKKSSSHRRGASLGHLEQIPSDFPEKSDRSKGLTFSRSISLTDYETQKNQKVTFSRKNSLVSSSESLLSNPKSGITRRENSSILRVTPEGSIKFDVEKLPWLPKLSGSHKLVQCQGCPCKLLIPPTLQLSSKGIQKLRCAKCQQISLFRVPLPSDSSSESPRDSSMPQRRMTTTHEANEFPHVTPQLPRGSEKSLKSRYQTI